MAAVPMDPPRRLEVPHLKAVLRYSGNGRKFDMLFNPSLTTTATAAGFPSVVKPDAVQTDVQIRQAFVTLRFSHRI